MASLLLLALCGCPAAGQSSSSAVEAPQPAKVDGPEPTSNATDAHPGTCKTVPGQRPDSHDGREGKTTSEMKRDMDRLDQVQFSGKTFTGYGWNTTGVVRNVNSFALGPRYSMARTTLSDDVWFRETTDVVVPGSEAGSSYMIVVRYVYFD